MRITLSISNPRVEADEGDLLSLDVFPDMTLEALQNLIQAEAHIDPQAQHIYHNGQLITDKNKTMSDLGIADHDMLALHVRDRHPQIEPGIRGPPQPARLSSKTPS